MDLITAVITTHKRPVEILERALKSVLSQTYDNMEIIVVDDSPSNYECRIDVKRMVESYSYKNVKYIQHDKCKGACAARNTGIKYSRGKFIAFLDDDDEWKPSKIEKQLKMFVKDSIALVYCGKEIKDDRTGVVTYPKTKYLSGSVYPELIKRNFIGSTSFPLLRTSSLKEVGGFDELMQSLQDADVWLRISQKYEVSYVEEPLVIYHVHAGERITSNYVLRINGLERINEKNWDYIQAHKEALYFRLSAILPYYAGNRQMRKALKLWIRTVFLKPLEIKNNVFCLMRMIKYRYFSFR